jgi:hypothetical protein
VILFKNLREVKCIQFQKSLEITHNYSAFVFKKKIYICFIFIFETHKTKIKTDIITDCLF